jgi:hypothetical protein
VHYRDAHINRNRLVSIPVSQHYFTMDYPLSPLPSDQIIEPVGFDALGLTVPSTAAACNNPTSSGNCFRDFVLSFWSSEPDAQADAEQLPPSKREIFLDC